MILVCSKTLFRKLLLLGTLPALSDAQNHSLEIDEPLFNINFHKYFFNNYSSKFEVKSNLGVAQQRGQLLNVLLDRFLNAFPSVRSEFLHSFSMWA